MAFPALKSSDLVFLGLEKRLLESNREHDSHCPKPPLMQSLLFQMHFIFSDEVVLLFDFWSVHSPTGKNWEAQTCRLSNLGSGNPGSHYYALWTFPGA